MVWQWKVGNVCWCTILDELWQVQDDEEDYDDDDDDDDGEGNDDDHKDMLHDDTPWYQHIYLHSIYIYNINIYKYSSAVA